jgi:hypothetical protein
MLDGKSESSACVTIGVEGVVPEAWIISNSSISRLLIDAMLREAYESWLLETLSCGM